MDFEFAETLEQLRVDGRTFAAHEVAPSVVLRDQHRHWDQSLFAKLAEKGALGAFLPREYGGRGLSALETCAFLEGFGEGSGDAGLSLSAGVHGLLCAVPIWKLGSEAQKQKYLRRMASGEWTGGLSLF